MRRKLAILLGTVLLFSFLTGCGSVHQKKAADVWSFTDSCGREVELPSEIDRIVPSGPLAQMVLYTLCPDKLQSLATPLTRTQKKYINKKYWDLPVTGQFYGGGSTVSYETIIATAPDVIIDIGETKDGIADDMDSIQKSTGIPTVFVQAELTTMADAYETLGKITGEEKQAGDCAAYIRETLAEAEKYSARVPRSQRKRVLFSQGEYGTEVLGAGSIHSEVLDLVGAINVAQLNHLSSNGNSEVSMEQILTWNPEVVILSPDSNYDEIFSDPLWASVQAVKTGAVYEVPGAPYNWMDRPPSVQRILAVKWLGNLLYPEAFPYDMIEETQEFYSLFYHDDLTQAEARALLAHSTEKLGENG